MYRLMLVDDEVFIVDGLCNYLQKTMPDMIDVVKAYSGQEAIEHISKTRIDIVLSDINMPGMDGFELFSQIGKYWPACKFIFLTGHANFDYVYRALKNSCVHFLLKNEGYGPLEQTIRQVIAELNQENRELNRQETAFSKETGKCLSDFFMGEPLSLPDEKSHLVPSVPCLLVAASPDFPPSEGEAADQRLSLVESYSQNFFKFFIHTRSFIHLNRYVFWIIQPASSLPAGDTPSWLKICQFTKGMAEALQTVCQEALNISISFALSVAPAPFLDLPLCASVLSHMLNRASSNESRQMRMLLYNCPAMTSSQNKKAVTALMGLSAALFTLNKDSLFKWSESLRLLIREKEIACAELAQMNTFLAGMSASFARHAGLQKGDAVRTASSADCTLGKALTEFEVLLDTAKHPRAKESLQQEPVAQIHGYIADHMEEPLLLSDIAEHVHMNPSYLSRLYKKLCGENLFDYIQEARIERAKALLQKDRSRISNVAAAVGFNSVGYFSNVFKKKVGVSPQEYKRSDHEVIPGHR